MGESSCPQATTLLAAMALGKPGARDEFVRLVYDELREQAAHLVRGQVNGTLNATALVNEAYLKLFRGSSAWNDRAHFLATAALTMRQVLVDHARARNRRKREGTFEPVPLDEILDQFETGGLDLERLDLVLDRMAEFNPEGARAIVLRFFAGVSVEESAKILGMSRRTFERRVNLAKSWLWKELR
jgi:RNA polymerase sigma-70 factor, ECF subfamily